MLSLIWSVNEIRKNIANIFHNPWKCLVKAIPVHSNERWDVSNSVVFWRELEMFLLLHLCHQMPSGTRKEREQPPEPTPFASFAKALQLPSLPWLTHISLSLTLGWPCDLHWSVKWDGCDGMLNVLHFYLPSCESAITMRRMLWGSLLIPGEGWETPGAQSHPDQPVPSCRHTSESNTHCCTQFKFWGCLLCSIIVAKANRYKPPRTSSFTNPGLQMMPQSPGTVTHSETQIAVRTISRTSMGIWGVENLVTWMAPNDYMTLDSFLKLSVSDFWM